MQKEIHDEINADLAYIWSVEHNDPLNMCIVLRAYGYDHNYSAAIAQIDYAKTV